MPATANDNIWVFPTGELIDKQFYVIGLEVGLFFKTSSSESRGVVTYVEFQPIQYWQSHPDKVQQFIHQLKDHYSDVPALVQTLTDCDDDDGNSFQDYVVELQMVLFDRKLPRNKPRHLYVAASHEVQKRTPIRGSSSTNRTAKSNKGKGRAKQTIPLDHIVETNEEPEVNDLAFSEPDDDPADAVESPVDRRDSHQIRGASQKRTPVSASRAVTSAQKKGRFNSSSYLDGFGDEEEEQSLSPPAAVHIDWQRQHQGRHGNSRSSSYTQDSGPSDYPTNGPADQRFKDSQQQFYEHLLKQLTKTTGDTDASASHNSMSSFGQYLKGVLAIDTLPRLQAKLRVAEQSNKSIIVDFPVLLQTFPMFTEFMCKVNLHLATDDNSTASEHVTLLLTFFCTVTTSFNRCVKFQRVGVVDMVRGQDNDRLWQQNLSWLVVNVLAQVIHHDDWQLMDDFCRRTQDTLMQYQLLPAVCNSKSVTQSVSSNNKKDNYRKFEPSYRAPRAKKAIYCFSCQAPDRVQFDCTTQCAQDYDNMHGAGAAALRRAANASRYGQRTGARSEAPYGRAQSARGQGHRGAGRPVAPSANAPANATQPVVP